MKDTLNFIRDLVANNNREWFNANKERYLGVRKDLEVLTLQLIAGLSEFEPAAARMQPAECMYRIYRDTRFSLDKTPYKNHIGIYISPFGGKKSQFGGYYLHLEPDRCAVAGGVWCPTAPVLKAMRQSIYDNVEEYLEIINDAEFKERFPVVGENLLKTVPKGFPKDWEHIDLLRPRSFTVMASLDNNTVCSGRLMQRVVDDFRLMKPFNDFLNYTFEENPELPRTF